MSRSGRNNDATQIGSQGRKAIEQHMRIVLGISDEIIRTLRFVELTTDDRSPAVDFLAVDGFIYRYVGTTGAVKLLRKTEDEATQVVKGVNTWQQFPG